MEIRAVTQFVQSKLSISFIFLLRILYSFRYIITYKNFAGATEKDFFR